MNFIKTKAPFKAKYSGQNYAPLFRKVFSVDTVKPTKLNICALGLGECYINGKKVGDDVLCTPVSDYRKTLWYRTYDVTNLLKSGENVIAVICGNGWYNEDFRSSWNYNEAGWRDIPKVACEIISGEDVVLSSDESWKCKSESAIYYNNLRTGEYYDARHEIPGWNDTCFDDSKWDNAIIDLNPPTGVFRECICEPIRECAEYPSISKRKTGDRRVVFDIGQNISGYVRLKGNAKSGTVVSIRYAEQINEDGSRNLNEMENHYPETEFATDRYICGGGEFTWSPKFAYHGFQHIEIDGLDESEIISVSGVFVHQDINRTADFECSDELLNKMFKAGVMSTWSNMFYMLTDCPTREKLGWANDARASCDQVLTDFESEAFFEKWYQDVCDSQKDSGCCPGIISSPGWGYKRFNGPVSDGLLFEIPYQVYRHSGNTKLMEMGYPHFKKYLSYIDANTDDDGFTRIGLPDWAAPGFIKVVPIELINGAMIYHFLKIMKSSEEILGCDSKDTEKRLSRQRSVMMNNYLDQGGKCKDNQLTSVALMIDFGLYEDPEPLKQQLTNILRGKFHHHNCGMVGMRHIYSALSKCGLYEDAYKLLTASGYPSYKIWFDNGANTLWEVWENQYSRNHHMYSGFMSWLINTALGITPEKKEISPYFFKELTYAKGYAGKISVYWRRNGEKVILQIENNSDSDIYYDGKKLNKGNNCL